MRGRPMTRGTIEAITPQGANVTLDDGRDGFVHRADRFYTERVHRRDLAAGDSVEFVLGPLTGSELFDGLQKNPDKVIVLDDSPNGDRPNCSGTDREAS